MPSPALWRTSPGHQDRLGLPAEGSSSAEKATTGRELSMCANVHPHLHCSSNRSLSERVTEVS